MNSKLTIWHILLLFLVFSFTSCKLKTDYQRWEESELASGVVQDSIFLGISFGMNKKAFYAHCWELNKEGLVRQGPKNMTVQYDMPDLKFPAKLNFYPTFDENGIIEMPATVAYDAWAPWNRERQSDSLQIDVKNALEQDYGIAFMEIEHPTKGKAFVHVSGNRRINIVRKDAQHVSLTYTDLRKKEAIQKLQATEKG
ncbi:MAG: hypothetical protein AAF824_18205 [Bacteroidota bacterium]